VITLKKVDLVDIFYEHKNVRLAGNENSDHLSAVDRNPLAGAMLCMGPPQMTLTVNSLLVE